LTCDGITGRFFVFRHLSVFFYYASIMALKIKLARIGATHNPVYRVVVAEGRSRRDGRFVEILGTYSPKQRSGQLKLNVERADYWVSQGAIPTDTSRSLIKKARKLGDAPEAVPVEVAAPVEAAAAPVEVAAPIEAAAPAKIAAPVKAAAPAEAAAPEEAAAPAEVPTEEPAEEPKAPDAG
jgi:small subunit ribosomal protein S16